MLYWRVALSFAVAMVCFTPTLAAADDPQVIRRLTKHGSLSNGAARQVSDAVGKRMAKSADNFAPNTDPLRVAVSQRLFGTPTPPDAMSGAKIRLRLFSGLDAWALETLFKPMSGQIGSCQQAFALSSQQCTALVAAAGAISVADARKLAGGQAAPQMARAPMQQQPRFAPRPAQQQSRFGSFNSGFRGNAQPQRPAAVAAQQPLPAQRFGAAPQRVAPAPRPMVASPAIQQSTASAYKARRAARMARLQEERARKKAGLASAAAPAEAPAAKAPVDKPMNQAVAAAAPEQGPEEEGPAAEPQLDTGFLDGLLDDPLGKK